MHTTTYTLFSTFLFYAIFAPWYLILHLIQFLMVDFPILIRYRGQIKLESIGMKLKSVKINLESIEYCDNQVQSIPNPPVSRKIRLDWEGTYMII